MPGASRQAATYVINPKTYENVQQGSYLVTGNQYIDDTVASDLDVPRIVEDLVTNPNQAVTYFFPYYDDVDDPNYITGKHIYMYYRFVCEFSEAISQFVISPSVRTQWDKNGPTNNDDDPFQILKVTINAPSLHPVTKDVERWATWKEDDNTSVIQAYSAYKLHEEIPRSKHVLEVVYRIKLYRPHDIVAFRNYFSVEVSIYDPLEFSSGSSGVRTFEQLTDAWDIPETKHFKDLDFVYV